MDLLQPWIGPYVHQVLTEAQQWKVQSLQGSQPVATDIYEDDGSNLRVKSDKKAFVQFTKIDQITSPVQVWISDSDTHVKVTIAATAAEHFKRVSRRRITERTLGAIFRLSKFEVVAQHHGPKKTKITMRIQELQHVGSDGSPAFGSPRPIECLEDIQELLNGLHAFRTQGATSKQILKGLQLADSNGPSPSQPDSTISIESEDFSSQGAFATQAPRANSRKRTRAQSIEEDAFDSRADLTSNVNSNTAEVQMASGSQSLHKAAKLVENQSEFELGDLPPKLVESRNKANALGNIEDKFEKEHGINLLKLLDRTNKPQLTEVKLQVGLDRIGVISDNSPMHPPATSKEPFTTESETQGLDSQSRAAPTGQKSKQPYARIDNQNGINQNQPLPTNLPEPAPAINKTNLRLRRKDTFIPKNQVKLLDRSDAWYPPEPGQRPPTANIPITILQDLNRKADRQNTSSSESPQVLLSPQSRTRDQSVQTSSDDEQSSERHSDSDAPFPSAEWPASQEQNALPPDSSIEVAGASLNQNPRLWRTYKESERAIELNEPNSSPKGRQLTLSLTSDSDVHSSRSLRRSQRLAKASVEPSYDSEETSSQDSLRAASSGRPSTSHSSRAHSSSMNGAAAELQKTADIELQSRNSQLVDSKVQQIDASSLESETVLEALLPEPQSNGTTTDVSRVMDSQVLLDNPRHDGTAVSLNHQQENHVDQLQSSGPCSSSSDSDLEMTVPIALDNEKDLSSGHLVTQDLTSSGLHSQTVMQVERTPWPNARSNGWLARTVYPTTTDNQPRPSDSGISHNNIVSLPDSTLEAIVAGTAESSITPEDRNHHSGHFTEQLMQGDEVNEASPNQARHDGQFIGATCVNSSADLVSSIEETVLPLPITTENQVPLTLDFLTSRMDFDTTHDLKRKGSEPVSLPRNAPKRRKGLFARALTDTDCLRDAMQDPSAIGRQSRTEFFANLQKTKNLAEGNSSGVSRTSDIVQKRDRSVSAHDDIGPPAVDLPGAVTDVEEERRSQSANNGQVSLMTQVLSNACRESLEPDRVSQPREEAIHESSRGHRAVLPLEDESLQDIGASPGASWTSTTAAELRGPTENDAVGASTAKRSKAALDACLQDSTEAIVGHSDAQEPSGHIALSNPDSHLSQGTESTYDIRIQKRAPGGPPPEELGVPEVKLEIRKESSVPELGQATTLSLPDIDAVQSRISEQDIKQTKTSNEKDPNTSPEANFGTIFEEFKATYSDYRGNEQHFKNMCSKIEKLMKADRTEHPSLWDDFIIRHKTDYHTYLDRCAEDAQDPVPYEYFYRNHIEEPIYSKRIVTPKNLGQIIPSADKEQESKRSSPRVDGTGLGRRLEELEISANPLEKRAQVMASSMQDEVEKGRFLQTHRGQFEPAKRTEIAVQKPTSHLPYTTSGASDSSPARHHRKFIDLTGDDLESSSSARSKAVSPPPARSAKRSRLSYPWSTTEPKGSSSSPLKPSPSKSLAQSSPLQRSHGRLPNDLMQPQTQVNSVGSPRNASQPNLASRKPLGMQPPPTPSGSSPRGFFLKNDPLTSATVRKPHPVPPTRPERSHRATRSQSFAKDDVITPFKRYAQDYGKVKPGNGNSFAKPQTNGGTTGESSAQGGIRGADSKVNPFNFKLP